MKVIILAGGLGSRLSEETHLKPKPMVEIGGKPILWHIMNIYASQGFNDFVILLGFKGEVIKNYFINYLYQNNDIHINLKENSLEMIEKYHEDWKITLVDTGKNSMTGSRLAKARKYTDDKSFMLTYGDGVADIDLKELLKFHKKNKGIGTFTSVIPEGRFGVFRKDSSNLVTSFSEKKDNEKTEINAGFFVFENEIFNYLNTDDSCVLEEEPLSNLAKDKKLYSYPHEGFWKCMDTLKDKKDLERLWTENPKWKIW